MTVSGKLREAARLADEARRELDVSSVSCDCCGARRYHNFTEFKAEQRLQLLVDGLVDLAGQVEKVRAANGAAKGEGRA